MDTKFTWKPIYRELAEKLTGYRHRQGELIALLAELEKKGIKVIKLTDQFADGTSGILREIDPFSFFSSFNRGITFANRQEVIRALKNHWNLKAEVPQDFAGIPIKNNMSAWFIRFAKERKSGAVDALWTLAEAVLKAKNLNDVPPETIDACLNKGGGSLTSITMGMFWFSPEIFPARDKKNRAFAQTVGVNWGKMDRTGANYLKWAGEVCEKFGSDLGKFSDSAHLNAVADEDEEDDDDESGADSDEGGDAISNGANRARVWAIAAGRGGSSWEDFKATNQISVGWKKAGDLDRYAGKDSVVGVLGVEYPDGGKNQTNAAQALWDFARVMAPGDYVVVKQGKSLVLGIGRITGDYSHDVAARPHPHHREVTWLKTGEWQFDDGPFPIKTLTNITRREDLLDDIKAMTGVSFSGDDVKPVKARAPYSMTEAMAELFMSEDEIKRLRQLLARKKNLILQGPPGVGKTFAAKRLAWLEMGERDSGGICTVQFHPSYSYEDFVQGVRSGAKGGFEVRKGLFYLFCERAQSDPARPYFFIIDEINRGNLAKIFGELMQLVEVEQRGVENAIPLMYSASSAETFHIPENLHIIGTMNTADRSLSLVDYALRRRFVFAKLNPAFETEGFKKELERKGYDAAMIEKIRQRIGVLNKAIAEDTRNLGEGYQIGHSFFCTPCPGNERERWYADIISCEIQPLLEEYWLDQPAKCREELAKLNR